MINNEKQSENMKNYRKSKAIQTPSLRSKERNVGLYIFLSLLAIFWLFPLLIVVFTSIKTQMEVVSRGVFVLPLEIHLENFLKAWETGHFNIFYRNSLIICFTKVPAGIFVASLAAFPLAKYNFRLRDTIFLFFLLGLGIPIHIILLPVSIMLKKMHLLNTLGALFFPYIAYGLPLQILICRGFFRTIPTDMIDAARIDGCSEFTIYLRILLPLAKPALAALFIIDFLATWNEFLMALIFIHSEKWKTVPLGMMYFQGQFSSSYPLITAGTILSILPVLIIFFSLQRYFVAGITAGALKG